MKALLVDPMSIRPLPGALWDIACERCNKRQSRWEVFPRGMAKAKRGFPVCSLCWLYESEWGKAHVEEVTGLIERTEAEMGKKIEKTPEGRIRQCADADAIMGAVALTSRLAAYGPAGGHA